MNCNCPMSNVTTSYIDEYQCIKNTMIEEMTSVTTGTSISSDFIARMIPHHMAAINMCQNLLQYTTDIPLQNMALGIISEQEKSISNMTAIASQCENCTNSDADVTEYSCKIRQIMQTMFTDMSSARINNNINADFMREMIPHHMGAVKMCGAALSYNICSGLRPILEAIISSQEKGIRQMRCMLNRIPPQ